MSDYRSQHQPPEDGAPLHDLIGQFPDDVYERPDLYDHTGGTSLADRDSARAIRRYRGKPNDLVTIYRAVPPGVTEIETGNWVTLSEQYALDHSYQFGDDVGHWPILSASVPVHTVRNGGNDIVEWGYWGPTIAAKVVKEARRIGPWYHASDHDLPVGATLIPGGDGHKAHGDSRPDRVYFSNDPWVAISHWPITQFVDGVAALYEVRPIGEIEDDANFANGWEGMSHCSPSATVVRRVPIEEIRSGRVPGMGRRFTSKTASAFQPSLVASWESTRPWDASRADLEAQRVPGFRVGNARGTESASFEGGFIVLKEQWFTYEADTRRAICYHEAGHGLETAADYAEIAAAFGVDSALDIIDLPGAQRFGYDPDEIVAQAYSVLWCEPQWATFEGGPEILAAVARLAQAHGYPLPSGARTARWAGTTPERDLVLYHGTSLDKAEAIAREGFRPLGSHVNVWTWYTLTTSQEQAARYAQGDGPQAVVEFTIPAGTQGILGRPADHGAYDFDATAYGVVNPIPASMVTAVIPLPERRTASSSGPIYRGVKVTLPASLRAEVDALLAPPTDASQIDQERRVASLVVPWLQANHWDTGVGLGRHWTTRKDMAETAAIQGGGGNLGIVLTATYDPQGVDHSAEGKAFHASEAEVTLLPGASLTITDIEFPFGPGKGLTLIDRPIRATASITRYYHGTTADLPPGTILVPGGEKAQARGDRYVHFTTDLDTAFVFAGANGDVGHVYEVEPIGDVQPWRFNEFSYRAPQARILREVSLPKTASAPARLFHGTPHALPIGTILVPGGPDGTLEVGGHQGRHKFVWMADTVAGAKGWGEHYTWNDDGKTTTRHPGHIYEVEPIGECWQPPAFPKGDYDGPIGSSGCWVAPQARIIAEVGPRGGRIKPTAARPHPDAIIEKDGYLTYAFSMADTGLSGVVEVYDGSLLVGTLLFMDREGNGTAIVEGVEVHSAYRRQGIATRMLEMARRLWHGEEIIHSTTLTEDGAAWSRRVGSSVRRLSDLSDAEFASKRWVYHGTRSLDDLHRLLTEGVRKANVPMNLNRRRFQSGDIEGIFFQPGAGVGMGLYVGDFANAQQFGDCVVAIEVDDDDLGLPPEAADYADYFDDPIAKALRDANGAMIVRDIPASRVYLVAERFARYERDPMEMARNNASGINKKGLRRTALADGDQIREHLLDLDLPNPARDGDCIWVSGAVAKVLKKHGWDAEVEQITGWDYLMGHKVVVFAHMAVRIGDTIVDASATQYDATLPPIWVVEADQYLNDLAEATGVMQVSFGMSATGVNYDALARSEP